MRRQQNIKHCTWSCTCAYSISSFIVHRFRLFPSSMIILSYRSYHDEQTIYNVQNSSNKLISTTMIMINHINGMPRWFVRCAIQLQMIICYCQSWTEANFRKLYLPSQNIMRLDSTWRVRISLIFMLAILTPIPPTQNPQNIETPWFQHMNP